MREGSPQTIYRKDYTAPEFAVDTVALHFEIHPGKTLVTAELALRRTASGNAPLVLDGEHLSLQSIAVDGRALAAGEYQVTDTNLVVDNLPDDCRLQTVVEICPEENTSLEGLYRSRTMYATQCEAEGFRKITYYLDRPDVLALFTVTVDADLETCPVLLSNGNLQSSTTLDNGRHRTVWHDPFPKPCYLFALVAGDLACVEDSFVTCTGKDVALRVFVEAKDANYCGHAIESLKKSMRWDETVYGLEYDLDLFNIVAVDDFNMGAMENKSLNIFNTSCVLADPDITTDMGYQRIEAIVAHEYFHNFSGNRVTCRDWFQLSLKEGFTVFRDSEFTADMHSRGVKRVEDVAFLRTHQFAEDAGPMAHPVRPDSFIEISNFYTLTVYEKGAEVVRMLHTLLGAENFQKGATLYFERHDGQAVTCDDFVSAMEDASGRNLGQFRRWYEQAGTPRLSLATDYNAENQQLTLNVTQENHGADEPAKPPLMMPLSIGLLVDGRPMLLDGDRTTRVLEVTEQTQQFVIDNVVSEPVLSPLRGFSAPVRLSNEPTPEALLTLMQGDDDSFVRWDAAQSFAAQVIEAASDSSDIDIRFIDAYGAVIKSDIDPALKAHTLALPGEEYLADRASQRGLVDVFAIRAQRQRVKSLLAMHFEHEWRELFTALEIRSTYTAEGAQIGARAMRHLALDFLCHLPHSNFESARDLFSRADNLTDRLAGARGVIHHADAALRKDIIEQFYSDWQHQTLVINQWFSVQATRPAAETVETVQDLMAHEAFELRNPNKLRALVGAFAGSNPVAFHRQDGAGYTLLADTVAQIQAVNPQIAARMLTPLTRFRRYAHGADQMQLALQRLAGLDDLSRDVFEVLDRSLKG